MTRSAGPAGGARAGALARALSAARDTASAAAEDLLQHVPDTGDAVTGRAVDDFVDQAGDALRALAESLGETIERLAGTGSRALDDLPPRGARTPGGAAASRGPGLPDRPSGRGWGW